MLRGFMLFWLVVGLVSWPNPTYRAVAQEQPARPSSPHCRRAGPAPLDPEYCGCTWGAVYYRGAPVHNAPVQLHFAQHFTQTVTLLETTIEPFPYYITSGASLGARRSDVMTVTTTLAGQTATRAFRAQPDSVDREQEITLVLPEQGVWNPVWLTGGYTRTLLLQGNTLWAGGPAGLIKVDLTTGQQQVQTLPWSQSAVVAVALAPNDHLWAAGPNHLAEWDGSAWQNRPAPFAEPIRALAIDPASGAVWVGGGNSSAALAVYDGAWHSVTAITDLITALTVDTSNQLWVGTWGGGVYRHAAAASNPTTGWTRSRVNDGLASDYIYAIAATNGELWIGTRPYDQSQRHLGGVSQYELATNTWRTYTTTHGLPAEPTLPNNPAHIYAVMVDAQGAPWASTPAGLYRLATPALWLKEIDFSGDAVRALANAPQQIFAGRATGAVAQLDLAATFGQPPTVQLILTQPITVEQGAQVQLTASASDPDNTTDAANPQILAWDWQADQAGSLCTTAELCSLDTALLGLGVHTISLRVQDDEGVWSPPVTTRVVVVKRYSAYLPQVRR